MTNWELHGMQMTNCSCAYGCPCQFNALPTHGYCRATSFMRIDKGTFGGTRLDGLNMGMVVSWPGAVHEGRGTMQPVIDERASDAQRSAMLNIMTGKETEEMATFFAVYAAMCDTLLDPIHTRIELDIDMDKRLAKVDAKGIAKVRGEPIVNATTKLEYRGSIVLPNGFEFARAEVGRGWSESSGEVAMVLDDTHAHWNEMHVNQSGRIH